MEHLDLEDTYNLLRRYVIGMKALAWFWWIDEILGANHML
jgi:hypothetical protein